MSEPELFTLRVYLWAAAEHSGLSHEAAIVAVAISERAHPEWDMVEQRSFEHWHAWDLSQDWTGQSSRDRTP